MTERSVSVNLDIVEEMIDCLNERREERSSRGRITLTLKELSTGAIVNCTFIERYCQNPQLRHAWDGANHKLSHNKRLCLECHSVEFPGPNLS